MSWKISVALPVPPFNRQKKVSTTLLAGVTTGAVITTNDTSIFYKLLPGDIVKIGPSSYAGSEGKYEYGKASSIAAGSITLIDNLINDYSSTDKVEVYSSAIASGWNYFSSYDNNDIEFWIAAKDGITGSIQQGYLNNFGAQYMRKDTGDTSGFLSIYSNIPYNLERNYTYRLGGYYKTNSITNPDIALRLFQDDSSFYSGYLINLTSSSGSTPWVKLEGVATTSLITPTKEPAMIQIQHPYDVFGGYYAYDCIYLTHAMNTDGEASGAYTIPINPNSVIRLDKSHLKKIRAQYGKEITYGPLLENQMRGYGLKFNLGNKTMIANLSKLLYFQNLGFKLMLESDISSELPLFGFMNYRVRYVHWDKNVIAIDLSFVGV